MKSQSKNDVVKERWYVSAVKNDVRVSGLKVNATEIYAEGSAEWLAQVLRPERAAQIVAEHNEVQELRSLNQTQADSIETFQSQLRVMKEAIEAVRVWISVQAETWTCQHADQPMRCSRCSLRQKAQQLTAQLSSAITPKGSEQ